MIKNRPSLTPLQNGEFKLNQDLVCEAITVPKGYQTDLASVPRFLWWYISPHDYGILYASILHDWLYATEIVSRKKADQLFYKVMRHEGYDYIRSLSAYYAVRGFGWMFYGD